MTSSERLDLIEWSAEQGWALLPLKAGSKKPRADVAENWGAYRLTSERVRSTFADDGNVGVLLGEPSRGLLDVDLDCHEALELAPAFLPENAMTFGRMGKPRSHWLYTAPSSLPPSLAVEDVPALGKSHGAMLVELRATGRQTMFPPSIHPCGEVVNWTREPNEPLHPQPVDGADLRRRVELLGAACFVARYHAAGMTAARAFAESTLPAAELLTLPVRAQAKIAELCHAPRPMVAARRASQASSGESWIARVNALGVAAVAAALDLTELPGGSWATCPACTNEKRGSHDKRGAIGVRRDGRGWRCHSCGTTGDAIALAAWVIAGKSHPDNWRELRAALKERGVL